MRLFLKSSSLAGKWNFLILLCLRGSGREGQFQSSWALCKMPWHPGCIYWQVIEQGFSGINHSARTFLLRKLSIGVMIMYETLSNDYDCFLVTADMVESHWGGMFS